MRTQRREQGDGDSSRGHTQQEALEAQDQGSSRVASDLLVLIGGFLGTVFVNVVATIIANKYPQVLEEYPIVLRMLPWVAIVALWLLVFYWYLRMRTLRKWFGIEGVTGLIGYIRRLQGSGYHPSACMDRIDSHLDFMGHGASKWTQERDRMGTMLQRTYSNGGRIRFLLLDPASDVCQEASRVFSGRDDYSKKIVDSLLAFKPLLSRYRHLEIRLYCHRPQFRLTFDDQRSVSVGHYMGYGRGSNDTPLLICTRKGNWSFYTAFRTHFEDEWDRATPVDWDEIARLYQMNDNEGA